MGRNGWKWLEWMNMAGYGWRLQEMARNAFKCPEVPGNVRNLMIMFGNVERKVLKWLYMVWHWDDKDDDHDKDVDHESNGMALWEFWLSLVIIFPQLSLNEFSDLHWAWGFIKISKNCLLNDILKSSIWT